MTKVIVDTSVIIAASLKCTYLDLGLNPDSGFDIEDLFYKISRPLLEFFVSNVDKRIGIVTAEIESSADEELKKAILKAIDKIVPSKENIINQMSAYSMVFTIIKKQLSKNLKVLIRETINEKSVRKISFQVAAFYGFLIDKLNQHNPHRTINKLTYSAPKGFQGIMRHSARESEGSNIKSFRILKRKLEENPPDQRDIRVLSQAIYFREKNIFPGHELLIASTDQHFCKVRIDGELNTFVPDAIFKKFGIRCFWPDETIEHLKK